MTQTNLTPQINWPALMKYLLVGTIINLMIVMAFIVSVRGGRPELPWYWVIRPLLIVPFAGAVGGTFFYLMKSRFPNGWVGLAATILSILVHVIGLWMSFVLGFVGTYWH